ncbi:hypothetical protein QQS21_002716 [Conoideocrella luteorostrata]|uniref:C2H2-type domain-containing protein n=1 Tax=Conoideocrella luteorostrata TaxID=1105319 RepID=A0AAJ0CYP7_9HYPO|nr:hypothetical protein QQS21_002716 [Conoideocrella luteorostrata]
MSRALGEGESWFCKPCKRQFPNWESLLKHKAYKRKTGSEDHIHCEFCGQDFKTEASLFHHVQQSHSESQNLRCPGCRHGPFARLSSLMEHIETGACIRVDSTTLDDLREKKLAFTINLEALTKEAVKNNYAQFVSPKSAGGPSPRHLWGDAEKSSYALVDDGSPGLCKKSANLTKTTGDEGGGETRYEIGTAWKGKENLLSDALPGARPMPSLPESATRPSEQTAVRLMDPDDPDNPSFNAARYYSDIIQQFVCPKDRCGKVFKTRGGLIGHLRSPAHGDITYRCPCCLKIFKSLTAITSHAESSSVHCRIREMDGYEAYLDQLTAGIVSIENRNKDGTWKYSTTKSIPVVQDAFHGKRGHQTKQDPGQVRW